MFFVLKNKQSHFKLVADPHLLFMGITYWIVCIVICLITLEIGGWQKNIVVFYLFIVFFLFLSCVIALPKWLIIVELSENGISYKPIFKKKIEKKFSDFGYFYCAYYTYFTKKKYIVFSQRRLSDYEISHINNVSVSDKLIKIKVRKGLKEKLTPFLQQKYLSMIPKDFFE